MTEDEIDAAVQGMVARGVGAVVPLALLRWVADRDGTEPPPAIDSDYDMGLQWGIIHNEQRLRSRYGMFGPGSRARHGPVPQE